MAESINIVIDDRDPQNPILVEIEDNDGNSIRIGRKIFKGPYTMLNISKSDIDRVNCKGDYYRMIRYL